MVQARLFFFLIISTISAFEIIISSKESTQQEKFIFNTFSETADMVFNQEKIKFTFLTSTKNNKIVNFESMDIEMMYYIKFIFDWN